VSGEYRYCKKFLYPLSDSVIFTRLLTAFSAFASQTIDTENNIIREIFFKSFNL